jgi:uncharacterized protein (UPF0276 family)
VTGLPDLGVGIVYWPAISHLIAAVGEAVDVVEVEPQPFWFAPASAGQAYQVDRRALEHLGRLRQPKLVHGVGFPIGGTAAPDHTHLEPFVESIVALGAPWASEHLSFNRVRRRGRANDVGFLLPPVQSAEGVALAASNIRAVAAHLPVPFAFETGVSYLQPTPGELSDGAYFASVAEAAGCGILLDVHNVWTNERNGRQPVLELVEELPLERVWELHVAGGQELDGLWVDAHSGLAPPPVLELARQIVPRLPNLKAIVFEIMPEYAIEYGLTAGELLSHLAELREIWGSRGSRASVPMEPGRGTAGGMGTAHLPAPAAWEEALAGAVSGWPATGQLAGQLDSDPGVGVLRRLVGSVRAGKVAASLKLTTRLLLLALGEDALQVVFEDFWRSVPSELAASEEARGFAVHLEEHPPEGVPYLADVLAFELAAARVLMRGQPEVVHVACDLVPVIAALREGRLPGAVQYGAYAVTVEVPTNVGAG